MSLTPRQALELGSLIRRRSEELAEDIRSDKARSRAEPHVAVAGEVHDLGDEAAADLAVDVTRAERERDLTELAELQAAAKRLDDGAYGACLDCGNEVEAERLYARPGAPRCLACQARHEKTYAASAP